MSFATYLSFILTSLVIESTPGPNMAYLAVVSASKGRYAGLAATLGVALGLLIVGIVAALGMATLISHSPLAYQILRLGGVLYMLWLAWDGWQDTEDMPRKAEMLATTHYFKFFKRGLFVNLLNPKAAVLYITILPTFIDAAFPIGSQVVILTLTYVLVATLIHGLIVILASYARRFMEDRKRRLIVQRGLSLALVAIALWFAWTTGGGI